MSKFLEIMNSIEHNINKTLKENEITTRSPDSNGIWCGVLIPSLLASYLFQYELPYVYRIVTVMSLGMMMFSLLFILFLSISASVITERVYSGQIVSTVFCILLLYLIIDYNLPLSIFLSLLLIRTYSLLLVYTLEKYSKVFTLGEAMIVVQSIVLFVFAALMNIAIVIFVPPVNTMHIIATIIQVGLLWTVSMILVVSLYYKKNRNLKLLRNALIITGTGIVFSLHLLLRRNPLIWIFKFILFDQDKLKLISLWLASVLAALFVLIHNTTRGVKASSSMRKVFHGLVVAVFLPGMLYETELMCLASGVAFALLILLESIRMWEIKPISTVLQDAFEVFGDKQDAAGIALTPIYLFVGISCPLVLTPHHPEYKLKLLSGLLSVGIGDSMASIIGKKYGFHRLHGSERSIEGVVANVTSQIATIGILHYLEVLPLSYMAMVKLAAVCIVSSMVEAKTNQIDNLILPLITLCCLELVS